MLKTARAIEDPAATIKKIIFIENLPTDDGALNMHITAASATALAAPVAGSGAAIVACALQTCAMSSPGHPRDRRVAYGATARNPRVTLGSYPTT